MRIAVLQPSYRGSTSAIAGLDTRRDLTALLPGHEVEHVFLDKPTVNRDVRRLRADVVVNLCDGAWDEDTPGVEVVQALEREAMAFTGAGSAFYDPTRVAMKQACGSQGIGTPAYVVARDARGAEEALDRLRLPCFVKPEHGYNSVGVTAQSRVETATALRERVEAVIAEFGGALVEEYIAGREVSVLVASHPAGGAPIVYPPVECLFEPGVPFKTFDYKWRASRNPWVRCGDPDLASRLEAATALMFTGLGGTGYARSDIRVTEDGRLFVLELNPNCSLFYPDDNGATADVILAFAGEKAQFVRDQLDFALWRREQKRPRWVVKLDPLRGHGIYATRDLAAGEAIYALEERPHVLVTRSHVERTWDAARRELFRRYAWPITDETWVMWSDDPAEWRPINHACDPNAWVTGLDLRARRPIAAGEEITLDYATMLADGALDEPCTCGPGCRGGWRGDDCRQPWFRERYGEHVTDYIRQRVVWSNP